MADDLPLEALSEALSKARGASQMYLRFAIEALATEGAQGTLIIHIPRNPNRVVDVEFHGINPPKE